MRIFSDLGQGGRGDGAALRGGLPRPDPQLRGGPQHAEVRLLRREHLHLDTQGDISIFILTMIITHKVPWTFAIKSWFSEKDLFRYGHSGNNLTEVSGSRYLHSHYLLTITKVGHYTQMVWSSSHKVGCGFAKCVGSENSSWKKYYAYVCNYCPQ